MKNILLAALLPILLTAPPSTENYLITGTYTRGKSEGIYVYKFNSNTGAAALVSQVKASNPSFIVVSPNEKFVYAVSEDAGGADGGKVAAYSFNKKSGELQLLNSQSSGGDHPCYVDIDKTGKWLFTANYSSGSLTVTRINEDGSLSADAKTITHTGSSANKDRQDKPHVHCTFVSPDNKFLYVPDLGIDKVMIYAFNASTGELTAAAQPYAASEPGAGPRHITFHPNRKFAYVIEELTGHVVAYQVSKGKLNRIQRISTIAKGKTGFAGSADIHVSPDGRFLYASNRGDFNDFAVYSINNKSGKLAIASHQSTLGKAPRNFNFDPSGNYLLAGNQDSDQIVVFRRNKKTGALSDSGTRIEVGKPVCLKWISKD